MIAHMALMCLAGALVMLVHHPLKILRFVVNTLVCPMQFFVGQHGHYYIR